jgi:mono/diheme cytochrome c family protein
MLVNKEKPENYAMQIEHKITYLRNNNYFGYKDRIINLIDKFTTEVNEPTNTQLNESNFNNIHNYVEATTTKVEKGFTDEEKNTLKTNLKIQNELS